MEKSSNKNLREAFINNILVKFNFTTFYSHTDMYFITINSIDYLEMLYLRKDRNPFYYIRFSS